MRGTLYRALALLLGLAALVLGIGCVALAAWFSQPESTLGAIGRPLQLCAALLALALAVFGTAAALGSRPDRAMLPICCGLAVEMCWYLAVSAYSG